MIVYQQNFEWDLREAASNLAAYGVSFKEASTVFAAEDVAITEDVDSDQLYARGTSARGRMLIVLHMRGARVRILGAMVQEGKPTSVPDDAKVRGDEGASRVNEIAPAVTADAASVANEPIAPVVTPDAAESIASPETAVPEAPTPQDVADVIAPIEPTSGAAPTVQAATGATEAKEIPAPEAAPRPRRRIVPHRPRTEDTSPVVQAGVDVAKASTPEAVQPSAAIVRARPIAAPEAAVPARRPGRPRRVPRVPASASVPERKAVAAPAPAPAPAPEKVAKPAPSGRAPGAGMSAEEYGVYWDAYAAARDEAKLQGKSLHVAQRLGREAGERAVAFDAPTPKVAEPPQKAPPKAKAPAAKKVSSWRAAARGVKLDE